MRTFEEGDFKYGELQQDVVRMSRESAKKPETVAVAQGRGRVARVKTHMPMSYNDILQEYRKLLKIKSAEKLIGWGRKEATEIAVPETGTELIPETALEKMAEKKPVQPARAAGSAKPTRAIKPEKEAKAAPEALPEEEIAAAEMAEAPEAIAASRLVPEPEIEAEAQTSVREEMSINDVLERVKIEKEARGRKEKAEKTGEKPREIKAKEAREVKATSPAREKAGLKEVPETAAPAVMVTGKKALSYTDEMKELSTIKGYSDDQLLAYAQLHMPNTYHKFLQGQLTTDMFKDRVRYRIALDSGVSEATAAKFYTK